MNNKNFKEEVAGMTALLCGVIGVLTCSMLGNPNALGETLFWVVACSIFCMCACASGIICYTALTIWEKNFPHNFTTTKRKSIIKINRAIESFVAEE